MNFLNNRLQEIYYVTGNSAKYEEAALFFRKHSPAVILKQYGKNLDEFQTLDQKSIALSKAQQAWEHLKKPVLVDDAGVYFDTYPNFPGTMTKFIYSSLGLRGIFKLFESGERMSIRVVLILMWGDNQYILIDESVGGTFDKTHRLDLHRKEAPFDTVFIPDGTYKTVDELREEGKAEPYQYRIRALMKLASIENPPTAASWHETSV